MKHYFDIKVSAFVVTYERPTLLRACLRRARFADELIVVDKSSNDETEEVAREIADRYVKVPWTPTADDTREYAQSLCTHDWILRLDDDELMSVGAGGTLRLAANQIPADVFYMPIQHYILGRWDDRITVEMRPSFYRKGSLTYPPYLHTEPAISGQTAVLGGGDVYIQHLSHPTVYSWFDKCNRYTTLSVGQSPDRQLGYASLQEFTYKMLADRFASLEKLSSNDNYTEALALMSAIYDIIEGLKVWEKTQPDGHAAFAAICEAVENEPR